MRRRECEGGRFGFPPQIPGSCRTMPHPVSANTLKAPGPSSALAGSGTELFPSPERNVFAI